MQSRPSLVILLPVFLAGCAYHAPIEIHLREPSSQSPQDAYCRWIYPGDNGLGTYAWNGRYAFDSQWNLYGTFHGLDGKLQTDGSVMTEHRIVRVITHPRELGARTVALRFECSLAAPLEERVHRLASALGLEAEIRSIAGQPQAERGDVEIHLREQNVETTE
jgi:hypothetical protein